MSSCLPLAADNLLCALHFTTLFALAASIPAEGEGALAANNLLLLCALLRILKSLTNALHFTNTLFALAANTQPSFDVSAAATALALAASLCWLGSALAKKLAFVGGTIPCVTALVLAFATITPSFAAPLVVPGEKMAALMLQVFFASIGANGNLSAILSSAPSLFLFILLQLSLHLLFTLSLGRLLSFPLKHLLISSNANVGGPTTAAGMAAAKGWRSLTVPAILVFSRDAPALKHLLISSNANVGGPTTAAGMAAAKGWRSLTVPAILVGIFGDATATLLL
ncbi:unnamed protein product [Closterium sp. Yama58-4]|nr:unnamed protein product [Closterium sp. Yama58-4]